MQIRALFWWDRLRSSFWLLPAIMALAALSLALVTVAIDHYLAGEYEQGAWWLYGGGPEGARAVLSVVASSMITVAGVVFSIMMVVLSLAAQQYGPRLLRNFMRDRITQCVLGVFVATFLYCLMVLRTIRSESQHEFVPHISVTVGVALALASLGVLIYFVHHVSVSIHIGEIISRTQRELHAAIESIFPETLGEDVRDVAGRNAQTGLPPDFERDASPVLGERAGYVQAIEDEDLFRVAKKCELLIQLLVRPGDFVLPQQALMKAWPADRLDDDQRRRLREAVITGHQRTTVQDIRFALNQQADIAVRALSPGINDPLTAIDCLDHLAEALCRIAERRMPSAQRYDEDNCLRVIASPVRFEQMLETSLGTVREYARGSAVVMVQVLEVLGRLSDRARREDERNALRAQLDAIARDPLEQLSPSDLAHLRSTEERVRKRLAS